MGGRGSSSKVSSFGSKVQEQRRFAGNFLKKNGLSRYDKIEYGSYPKGTQGRYEKIVSGESVKMSSKNKDIVKDYAKEQFLRSSKVLLSRELDDVEYYNSYEKSKKTYYTIQNL